MSLVTGGAPKEALQAKQPTASQTEVIRNYYSARNTPASQTTAIIQDPTTAAEAYGAIMAESQVPQTEAPQTTETQTSSTTSTEYQYEGRTFQSESQLLTFVQGQNPGAEVSINGNEITVQNRAPLNSQAAYKQANLLSETEPNTQVEIANNEFEVITRTSQNVNLPSSQAGYKFANIEQLAYETTTQVLPLASQVGYKQANITQFSNPPATVETSGFTYNGVTYPSVNAILQAIQAQYPNDVLTARSLSGRRPYSQPGYEFTLTPKTQADILNFLNTPVINGGKPLLKAPNSLTNPLSALQSGAEATFFGFITGKPEIGSATVSYVLSGFKNTSGFKAVQQQGPLYLVGDIIGSALELGAFSELAGISSRALESGLGISSSIANRITAPLLFGSISAGQTALVGGSPTQILESFAISGGLSFGIQEAVPALARAGIAAGRYYLQGVNDLVSAISYNASDFRDFLASKGIGTPATGDITLLQQLARVYQEQNDLATANAIYDEIGRSANSYTFNPPEYHADLNFRNPYDFLGTESPESFDSAVNNLSWGTGESTLPSTDEINPSSSGQATILKTETEQLQEETSTLQSRQEYFQSLGILARLRQRSRTETELVYLTRPGQSLSEATSLSTEVNQELTPRLSELITPQQSFSTTPALSQSFLQSFKLSQNYVEQYVFSQDFAQVFKETTASVAQSEIQIPRLAQSEAYLQIEESLGIPSFYGPPIKRRVRKRIRKKRRAYKEVTENIPFNRLLGVADRDIRFLLGPTNKRTRKRRR